MSVTVVFRTQQEANLALAAPDLLEALKQLAEFADTAHGGTIEAHTVGVMARAAIAKAEQ